MKYERGGGAAAAAGERVIEIAIRNEKMHAIILGQCALHRSFSDS